MFEELVVRAADDIWEKLVGIDDVAYGTKIVPDDDPGNVFTGGGSERWAATFELEGTNKNDFPITYSIQYFIAAPAREGIKVIQLMLEILGHSAATETLACCVDAVIARRFEALDAGDKELCPHATYAMKENHDENGKPVSRMCLFCSRVWQYDSREIPF